MQPVAILANLMIPASDRNAAVRYFQQISPVLRQVPGFMGVGLWQNLNDADAHLALYHYDSPENADLGLEAVASRKLLTEATVHSDTPPDVRRVAVQGKVGQNIFNTGLHQVISVSVRVADPGFGASLADEVGRILHELQLLPGYLGGEFGRNDSLDEEVIGLAAWENEAEFQSSVPVGTIYDVRVYRKVQ